MTTFWARTKRRAVAVLAAGAAGAAAAYCAYTWYTSGLPDASRPASDAESTDERTPTPGDEAGPSDTSGTHIRQPLHGQESHPMLLDPTGAPEAGSLDAAAHLQHHYDSIQQIADTTTLPALLPALARALAAADGGDATLDLLRRAKGGAVTLAPDEKRRLWAELAAAALGRLVAAIWALPLLSLQVRVQLNVLGRHLYLETALAEAGEGVGPPPPPPLSAPSQEAFLSFTEHLTKAGVPALAAAARHAADAALAGVPLDHEIDGEALGHLLSHALAVFAQDAPVPGRGGWAAYLLPEPAELREALRLRRPDDRAVLPGAAAMLVDVDAVGAMVQEVGCILSSERFRDVATAAARAAAGAAAAGLAGRTGGGELPLARLVPAMTAEAKAVLAPRGEAGAAVATLPEVAALCATVYSCGPPL